MVTTNNNTKYPRVLRKDNKKQRFFEEHFIVMKQLRNAGLGYKEIAKHMECSVGTIQRLLNSQTRLNSYKHMKNYQNNRYATDPEFRQAHIKNISKNNEVRRKDDELYRKYKIHLSTKYKKIQKLREEIVQMEKRIKDIGDDCE